MLTSIERDDLLQLYNVLVFEHVQDLDFANRCNGETLGLVLHFNLLDGHRDSVVSIDGLENIPERTLAHLVLHV